MNVQTEIPRGSSFLDEMNEFAGFSAASQRYIRRSLDVGLGRGSSVRRWARSPDEAASIDEQALRYARLRELREAVRECEHLVPHESLFGPLTMMAAHDLAEDKLDGFRAFRFLYERLIGARVRPWLPAAFCAAATFPHIHPRVRQALLHSMDRSAATAVGWSIREPAFLPQWVEKVEAAPAS